MRLNKPAKGHAFLNWMSSIKPSCEFKTTRSGKQLGNFVFGIHTCPDMPNLRGGAPTPHILLPVLQLRSSVDLRLTTPLNSYLCNVTSALDFIRQIHSTRKWGIYLNLVTHVWTVITQLGTSHVLKNKPWGPLTNTHSRIAVTFHVSVKISNKKIWWLH